MIKCAKEEETLFKSGHDQFEMYTHYYTNISLTDGFVMGLVVGFMVGN